MYNKVEKRGVVSMEEINIKDFIDYYKKFLIIVILTMFLCVLAIFIYNAKDLQS